MAAVPNIVEMSFEKIPIEVLRHIVLFGDRSDLKSLRIVNKTLAIVTAPFLFKEVEVWLQTNSLSRLRAIASNPVLSKHVHALTITNDYIKPQIPSPESYLTGLLLGLEMPAQSMGTSRGHPSWLDEAIATAITIEDFINLNIPEHLRILGWTAEQLFSAWTIQKQVSLQQALMETTNQDIDDIAYALANLPNLVTVRLSGGGLGGYRKLHINGILAHFLKNNAWHITRADGRQLSTLFKAAATASSSPTNHRTFITTFILDEYFWKPGPYTYSGTDNWSHPDFSILQPTILISALPFFSSITTLELALDYRSYPLNSHQIEANLTMLLSALPVLEHLTLHNTPNQQLNLHDPIHALSTTSLQSLSCKYGIFDPTDIAKLLETQSATLQTIELENTALLKGIGYVEFFTSLHRHSQPITLTLKGWFVEISSDDMIYAVVEEEWDEELFLENKELKRIAREGLGVFVRQERESFPNELLNVDETNVERFGNGDWEGLVVVIAGAKSAETGEVDY